MKSGKGLHIEVNDDELEAPADQGRADSSLRVPPVHIEGDLPHHASGHLAFDDFHEEPSPQGYHGSSFQQVQSDLALAFSDEPEKRELFEDEKIKKLSNRQLRRKSHTRPDYAAELDYRAYKEADSALEAATLLIKQADAEIEGLTLDIALNKKNKDEINFYLEQALNNPNPAVEFNRDTVLQDTRALDETIHRNKTRIKHLEAFKQIQKEPLEHKSIARKLALKKFTENFNTRYYATWGLKLALLVDDIPFSLYQLLMGSDTIIDFLKLFAGHPTVSQQVNNALVYPPTIGDFCFNMLTFTPGAETEGSLIEHYEKYGYLGYATATKKDYALLKEMINDGLAGRLERNPHKKKSTAILSPEEIEAIQQKNRKAFILSMVTKPATGLFNSTIKFLHNAVGAAANSYAIYETFKDTDTVKELGGYIWAPFSVMISLGVLYYSILMNPKYDKGGKILEQLATVVATHLPQMDITRSYIVFSRAILAATLLRALSFATIAVQIKSIPSSPLKPIPDSVLQIVMLVTVAIHTLRARASTTYLNMFAAKDELMKDFNLSANDIRKENEKIASVMTRNDNMKNFLRTLLPASLSGGFFGVLGFYYSKPALEKIIDNEAGILASQLIITSLLGLTVYQRYHAAMTQSMLDGRLLNYLKYKEVEKLQVPQSIIPVSDADLSNTEKLTSAIRKILAEDALVGIAYLIAGLSALSRTESGEYPTAHPLEGLLPSLVLVMGVTLLLGEQSFNSVQVFVANILETITYHADWLGVALGLKNNELPADYYMAENGQVLDVRLEDESSADSYSDEESEDEAELALDTLKMPRETRLVKAQTYLASLSLFSACRKRQVGNVDPTPLYVEDEGVDNDLGAEMSSSSLASNLSSDSRRSIGRGPGQ